MAELILTLCDRVRTTNRKILKIGESTHFYPRNIMTFDFYILFFSKGAGNSLFAVVGALRVFATIFVWTFTLYYVKYNGANFIIKMCVNPHKSAENSANCC